MTLKAAYKRLVIKKENVWFTILKVNKKSVRVRPFVNEGSEGSFLIKENELKDYSMA